MVLVDQQAAAMEVDLGQIKVKEVGVGPQHQVRLNQVREGLARPQATTKSNRFCLRPMVDQGQQLVVKWVQAGSKVGLGQL